MSEGNIPEVNVTPDVEEAPKALNENVEDLKAQEVAEEVADKAEEAPQVVENANEGGEEAVQAEEGGEIPADLGSLSLAELSDMFDKLSQADDRMKRYKEAEAIKSAFYKKLSKEKAEAGFGAKVDEPSSREDVIDEVAPAAQTEEVKDNPFEAMETAFKGVYANYKKERAEYNRQQDAQREENFARKQAVIEDLKNLVEKQEDVNSTFPAFRELQNRWREIGPVPATKFRDLNDTYQFYVEKFYDMVKINRDLRDLDFKKNLEAKEEFCQAAERLSENENVVEAFRELQKLHEQWKEFGPVAKEYRDSIWDRFKAATAVINKKYQAYFEGQKEKQQENLAEKTKLCEQVEAIAEKEVKSSNEWNALSTEIEDIQKKWRTIGFATRKENQKIYDRFRAACDKFFSRKREYYTQFKDSMNENMEKKLSLIEQAEALKDSKEWKKTTEALIALQKQWKEIGAVSRRHSDAIWRRFRAACDKFFERKGAHFASVDGEHEENLKKKLALLEEMAAADVKTGGYDVIRDFQRRWGEIGFVPIKQKDAVQKKYKAAVDALFNTLRGTERDRSMNRFREKVSSFKSAGGSRLRSERERLYGKVRQLEQEIGLLENNIGFFAKSKNAESLIADVKAKIERAREDMAAAIEKVKLIDRQAQEENHENNENK